MTEKNVRRGAGALLAVYLVFLLMKKLDVYGGFLSNVVLIFIVLAVFADKFGKGGAKLQKWFGAAAVIMFLMTWVFTGPTAQWMISTGWKLLPKAYFDANTGEARVKVSEEKFGGEVFPKSYNFDPMTARKLRPLKPEDVQELRAREDAASSGSKSSVPTITIPVSLSPGERWTADLYELVGGRLQGTTWTKPSGRVQVELRSGENPAVLKKCVDGPQVTEYCALGKTDHPRLTFVAMEATVFEVTAYQRPDPEEEALQRQQPSPS